MKYDIFLVSAAKDLDRADQIARRLRALKFKVRFDKKRTHTVPNKKDVADLDTSKSMLVLWSKTACDPDQEGSIWIYEMAERAPTGTLIQAALDRSVPNMPFQEQTRHTIFGLAPRKPNRGFNLVAGLLGDICGRPDLGEWLALTAQQKDEKAAWKAAHPNDPLSLAPAPKQAEKPKAASIPLAEVTESSRLTEPKTSKLKLKPPIPPTYTPTKITPGQIMVGAVCAGISFMLLFSYLVQSRTGTTNAIGNSALQPVAPCPAGEIPADLLAPPPPLSHGEIVDDTE